MRTIKTLIALALLSSVALVSFAKAPITPKRHLASAPLTVSASKGSKEKLKIHSKKPQFKNSAVKKPHKARTLAKNNRRANAVKSGNGKGPGLEAF